MHSFGRRSPRTGRLKRTRRGPHGTSLSSSHETTTAVHVNTADSKVWASPLFQRDMASRRIPPPRRRFERRVTPCDATTPCDRGYRHRPRRDIATTGLDQEGGPIHGLQMTRLHNGSVAFTSRVNSSPYLPTWCLGTVTMAPTLLISASSLLAHDHSLAATPEPRHMSMRSGSRADFSL